MIAICSAVSVRAQSFTFQPFTLMLGEKFCLFPCKKAINSLVFQSFMLSAHSFSWAMFSSLAGKTSLFRVTLVGIGGLGCSLLWKSQNRNSSVNVVLAKSDAHHSQVHSQTRRKTKFEQFASIELDGQLFMTPADFLESLTYRDLPGNDWHMETHPVTYRSNANLQCVRLNC